MNVTFWKRHLAPLKPYMTFPKYILSSITLSNYYPTITQMYESFAKQPVVSNWVYKHNINLFLTKINSQLLTCNGIVWRWHDYGISILLFVVPLRSLSCNKLPVNPYHVYANIMIWRLVREKEMLLLFFPPSPFSPLFSGPFYTYQVVGVVNKKKLWFVSNEKKIHIVLHRDLNTGLQHDRQRCWPLYYSYYAACRCVCINVAISLSPFMSTDGVVIHILTRIFPPFFSCFYEKGCLILINTAMLYFWVRVFCAQ